MPKRRQHKAPKRTRHYPPRTDLIYAGQMMDEAAYEKLCDAFEEITLLLAPLGFEAAKVLDPDRPALKMHAVIPIATLCVLKASIVSVKPQPVTSWLTLCVEVQPTDRVDTVTYITRYPNRLARKAKSAPYYHFSTNSAIDMLRHLVAMMQRNEDILL